MCVVCVKRKPARAGKACEFCFTVNFIKKKKNKALNLLVPPCWPVLSAASAPQHRGFPGIFPESPHVRGRNNSWFVLVASKAACPGFGVTCKLPSSFENTAKAQSSFIQSISPASLASWLFLFLFFFPWFSQQAPLGH